MDLTWWDTSVQSRDLTLVCHSYWVVSIWHSTVVLTFIQGCCKYFWSNFLNRILRWYSIKPFCNRCKCSNLVQPKQIWKKLKKYQKIKNIVRKYISATSLIQKFRVFLSKCGRLYQDRCIYTYFYYCEKKKKKKKKWDLIFLRPKKFIKIS